MVRSAVRGWVRSAVKLTDKTVIVTGGNTGLGYQTALDLAKRDARVVIACRNLDKAVAAEKQIEEATGSHKIATKSLDLSSFDSVRAFAEDFTRTEKRLDILINNAGIMKHPEAKTKDGFEMHFGVNHLGSFLLTNLLLKLIKESSPSRIINMASIAHLLGVLRWNDLNRFDRTYSAMGSYNASKLMNILFTRELSRRLEGTGVTANSVHPGIVRTELNRTVGNDGSLYGKLTDLVFHQNFLTVTPERGAQTQIYCAVAPELEKVTGKYFSNCHPMFVSWSAASGKNARKLWEISEQLTGFKKNDRD